MRTLGLVWLFLFPLVATAENPIWQGYANDVMFVERVNALRGKPGVTITPLARTANDRDVTLITLANGEPTKKPAILILGNTHAPHVAGSELTLRMAEELVKRAEEPLARQLLEQVTLYVVPRPDPDATAKAFASPAREVAGNSRRTDDDRDGTLGEDPPDDLNGDGSITLMRVADATGTWLSHPQEPRVLIEADPAQGERGQYRVFVEGRDDDGDTLFNEDGGDGVVFSRNFPHRYVPFQTGTGPNAVSEAETRAMVDFCYDHPEIFAVFCFSPEDNLFHPWKPGDAQKQRIPKSILAADAKYQSALAEKYRTMHGGKDAPELAVSAGSFAEWSYFQFGRWTFTARGWWPQKPSPKNAPADAAAKPADAAEKTEVKKAAEEKRGRDELEFLRWLEAEKLPGFAAWEVVEHPQFPGKRVEVGGVLPFYRLNPPVKMLEPLVVKHLNFVRELADARPRLEIAETKVESLGAGLWRVTVVVLNRGYLPTVSEMGAQAESHQHVQIKLTAPEKTNFLRTAPRVKLKRLEGGASQEITWLVQLPTAEPASGKLELWSPEVDRVEKNIELK